MPETSKCSLGQHFLLIDLWENFEIDISQGQNKSKKKALVSQTILSNFSPKIQVRLIYLLQIYGGSTNTCKKIK